MKTIPLSLPLIKKWLSAILLFVCANDALAQLNNTTEAESELNRYYSKKLITRVELLAGPNFIYPKEKYDENRVAKFGYAFNLNLVHDFDKSPLNLNLKLGYEQKGWNSISYSPNTDFSPPVTQKNVRKETLNYITLSLFTSYHPVKNLSIGIGAYYGRLQRFSLKYETYFNDSLISKYNGTPDPSPAFKKNDMGALISLGYDFHIKGKQVLVRFENNIGLYLINQPAIWEKVNRTYCMLIGIPLN
ncbi:MAG: hypothetical protein RI909_2135 [Bacteroidota bacterium]|jgi:hypothetical protein